MTQETGCMVYDQRLVRDREGGFHFQTYSKPCGFPADGEIFSTDYLGPKDTPSEIPVQPRHIPACLYHIGLFCEHLEDEDIFE